MRLKRSKVTQIEQHSNKLKANVQTSSFSDLKMTQHAENQIISNKLLLTSSLYRESAGERDALQASP